MQRAMLARLQHENMIEAIALAASQDPGSRIERAGGVAIIATTLPMRLFNQVVVDGAPTPASLARAVEIMRERTAPFVVSLRDGTDDAYRSLMPELGLVPGIDGPWIPGMAMHPLPPGGATPASPTHEIRRITAGAGVRDHIETAAAGFEMPLEWLELIVSERIATDPAAALYVGYTDGLPVTTGLGIRTGRTIGVYNIATVESARRRGYGAAMTMRIVDDGAAEGCDVAILQASEMGRPIYERLGFRTVVEYFGYVDPASLTRP